MEPEEIRKQLDEKFKQVQEDLAELQKSGASKEELKKATEAIKEQGLALQEFIDSQRQKVEKSFEESFMNFIKEKGTEIKNIYKSGTGEIVFNPFAEKVVGDITTGSGTDIDTPPLDVSTTLGSFNLRNDNDLLSLCMVSSSSTPSLSYTELTPKDGDYTFVAEGASKPQIDFKWENRYATPKKIAAHEILTEESVTDYRRLQSVAKEYLKKKHDLFKVDGVYFGDGTGINPEGATTIARTFVAGDMADVFAAGSTTFMDKINAVITDIYTTQNYTDEDHYRANLVMINPIDFFIKFQSAKDGNGLSLYPQASLFNSVTIGGVTIRPWIKIPSGKIFVADMKKYNVVNYVPFSIRIGWINDQFITNKFTMVGESRFFQYVKNLDLNAFVYDDISVIEAAIEAA